VDPASLGSPTAPLPGWYQRRDGRWAPRGEAPTERTRAVRSCFVESAGAYARTRNGRPRAGAISMRRHRVLVATPFVIAGVVYLAVGLDAEDHPAVVWVGVGVGLLAGLSSIGNTIRTTERHVQTAPKINQLSLSPSLLMSRAPSAPATMAVRRRTLLWLLVASIWCGLVGLILVVVAIAPLLVEATHFVATGIGAFLITFAAMFGVCGWWSIVRTERRTGWKLFVGPAYSQRPVRTFWQGRIHHNRTIVAPASPIPFDIRFGDLPPLIRGTLALLDGDEEDCLAAYSEWFADHPNQETALALATVWLWLGELSIARTWLLRAALLGWADVRAVTGRHFSAVISRPDAAAIVQLVKANADRRPPISRVNDLPGHYT
jgi:hypothetical protein